MEKYALNAYEGTGPDKQEIVRLKNEKWSQVISAKFLDKVIKEGTKVVDIGAGSSLELEKWIKARGGEYLAVDSSNEMLDARADSGEQFDVTMLATADDLSEIEDHQFDISHMKLVLMHLSEEKRLKAISEAIRVAKERAFFLDADWSNWGGTESVNNFVNFLQDKINKYRTVDNFIGRKMLPEIEGVAKKLGVKIGRVFEFKQEKGDHYHYLISLARGTYTKLINERVEDDEEKANLLSELDILVKRLESDRDAQIPIEMASLVGVEVLMNTLSEQDFEEVINIQDNFLLDNIEDRIDIERKGFIVNSITKEDLNYLIKYPERTSSFVYRNNGIQAYAVAFDIGLWRELRPELFKKMKLQEGFSLEDSDYHFMIGSTGKEVGSGMKASREICNILKDKGVGVVSGNIAEKPYLNKVSLTLHKRLRFERVGEITQERNGEEYNFGVFAKKVN